MSESDAQSEFENQLTELEKKGDATAAEWIAALDAGRKADAANVFTDGATRAQNALAKAGDVEGGIDLLKWRAEVTPVHALDAKDWLMAADVVAGANPHLLALINEAGFGQRLAARECVRRFRLLQSLKPGALCLHRTWGFGEVRKADSLYRKIEIDFDGHPGHGLAMKTAAESLELLSENHLLVRFHRDRDGVRQQVRENPAEVVKAALAGFGPLPAAALQEKLIKNNIVVEGDWKRFWDAARKALKNDKLVEMPAKRTDPIRLLDSASGYDETWYDRLSGERDIPTVLRRVRELAESVEDAATIAPAQRQVLANRLAFVLLGATSRQPGTKLAGAMLAARLQVPAADCDWPGAVREFLVGDAIVALLRDLPARDLEPALLFLAAQDAEGLRGVLLANLMRFGYTALQDVMKLLLKQGAGEDCRRIYAEACAKRSIRQEMLLWILRNPALREEWDLPQPAALAPMMVAELEQDYMGDRLKTQKTLHEKFEDPAWLSAVFNGMTAGRQQDFFRQISQSSAWPGLDRQVLQAKVLKLYPHLQVVITGESDAAPVATYGSITSHRSYRERQEQLERLINVDIPANSKEIAVARSYGDLSENFEYKAAKDMQSVLMARRADLETMISKVRPSDFSEAPKGIAGVGSSVELVWPDGHSERFHILGEWDQQPEMHIISSNTRLAKALAGKKAGDKAMIPSADGSDVECLLQTVEDLPADILEWAK